MSYPEEDDEGRVIPYDDVSIDDDDYLIRCITEYNLHNNSDGSRRVSSGAFSRSSKRQDYYRSMSVDLLSSLRTRGINPQDESYFPDCAVIMSLRVGDVRAADRGFLIGRIPIAENPSHCGVWNVSTIGKQRILKTLAKFIRNPENVTKEKR